MGISSSRKSLASSLRLNDMARSGLEKHHEFYCMHRAYSEHLEVDLTQRDPLLGHLCSWAIWGIWILITSGIVRSSSVGYCNDIE